MFLFLNSRNSFYNRRWFALLTNSILTKLFKPLIHIGFQLIAVAMVVQNGGINLLQRQGRILLLNSLRMLFPKNIFIQNGFNAYSGSLNANIRFGNEIKIIFQIHLEMLSSFVTGNLTQRPTCVNFNCRACQNKYFPDVLKKENTGEEING